MTFFKKPPFLSCLTVYEAQNPCENAKISIYGFVEELMYKIIMYRAFDVITVELLRTA